MALRDCITRIEKNSDGVISGVAARELIDRILKDSNATSETRLWSSEERIIQAATKVADEARLEAAYRQRNALLGAKAFQRIDSYIRNAITGKHHSGKGVTRGQALLQYMIGSPELIRNADGEIIPTRNSVSAQQVSTKLKYYGSLSDSLSKAKLLSEFKSGKHDADIFAELWHISRYKNLSKRNTGTTKNGKAFAIARIIYDLRSEMIARENKAGGLTKINENYAMRQTHDARRILRAGKGDREVAYKIWRDTIMPLLDKDKTFDGIPDRERYLRKLFDNIVSGEHGTDTRVPTNAGEGYARPGSLVKRKSANRVIHFKKAEGAWKYNQEFGNSSIRTAIMREISRHADDTVMMENFGPDPDRMFQTVLDHLSKQDRDFGVTTREVESTRSQFILKPRAVFDSLMGYLDSPELGRPTVIHRWMRNLQGVVTLSKLGAGFLSAIPDKAFAAGTLRYNGVSRFNTALSSGHATLDFLSANKLKSPEARSRAMAIGVGLDAFIGEMNARISFGNEPGTGKMYQLQQKLFTLNGMHMWNDAHKAAVGMTLANEVGQQFRTPWGKLKPDSQKVFSMYGIDEKAWKSVRQAGIVKAPDGTRFLEPANMQKLTDAQAAQHLLKGEKETVTNLNRIRVDLETKLRTMINDQVDDAVITPGQRERVLATLGTRAGTGAGTLTRMLTHFKSFPITVGSRVMRRDLFGHDTMGKGIYSAASTIATATIGGYLSMAVKDALKGKAPRPLMTADGVPDIDVLRDSVLRGGALGLYGDILLSEYDRAFNDPASVLSGPTVGAVFDTYSLTQRTITGLVTGEDQVTGAEALKHGVNNTPFANLYFIRPIVDYLVLNQINEALDPGYMYDLERKARKRNQEYFIAPSSIWDK